MSKERYICEEYETPYEEGYRVICRLEAHDKEIYNHALDDIDNIITEQLDKSDNQIECQTLRWVLDVLQDMVK